jgi:hypothetical protein
MEQEEDRDEKRRIGDEREEKNNRGIGRSKAIAERVNEEEHERRTEGRITEKTMDKMGEKKAGERKIQYLRERNSFFLIH